MDFEDCLNNLDSPDVRVRASGIIALGRTGDRRAAGYLTRVLEDRREVDWVRACAAIALGRIQGEASLHTLIEALRDSSPLVSRAAVSALGDLGSKEGIPYLEEILLDEGRRELQPAVVSALGTIGGSEAAPALLRALGNPDSGVKRNAAFALGGMRSGEAVLPLLDLLKHEDECLRAIAASSLGLIGDRHAIGSLIEALNDESETVRSIAVSSLGYLGDRAAASAVETALQDGHKAVRQAAEVALLKLRS